MKKQSPNDNIEQTIRGYFREQCKEPKGELLCLTLTADHKAAAYERYKNTLANRGMHK